MKKSILFVLVLVFTLFANTFGQKPVIELTFTADNNGQYVSLDSILIRNLTQGEDTMLYEPDTILVLEYFTGIPNINGSTENSFSISQNYPNPFKEKTSINLYLPKKEYIEICVFDILGQKVAFYENTLNSGNHSITFYPGKDKYYLFTVKTNKATKTIKMVSLNINHDQKCKIVYNGYEPEAFGYKNQQTVNSFVFSLGDEFIFVGYSYLGESGMIDSISNSQIYEFQFATNIPCPGTPTVIYEGKIYNTIQIFSQCWLKENLNLGTMIPGTQSMQHNGIIEKYCYNNEEDSCEVYGGLYQVDEMMQYTITGTQGICPDGWHIPSDEEWKILESSVDSQYGVGDPEWDNYWVFRGFDAGLNLKSASGWYSSGNGTNLYGFTAIPSGYRDTNCTFFGLGTYAMFWTSTAHIAGGGVWVRDMLSNYNGVFRNYILGFYGRSVRCLKD